MSPTNSRGTDLLDFAEYALKEFSAACPTALVGSLMRVDIFKLKLES
jgi:hypothetical protein